MGKGKDKNPDSVEWSSYYHNSLQVVQVLLSHKTNFKKIVIAL